MDLYHGSNQKVEDIDLSKCRPLKDFGKGFYLTTIKEQAFAMADNTVRIYGGRPVVSKFVFDESAFDNPDVNIREFSETPSLEWAKFVCNNRWRNIGDIDKIDCNRDNRYDIVIGPVANDKIAVSLRLFINDLISDKELQKRLTYRDVTNQYSFHTQKAIDYLTFKEAYDG